MLGICKLGGGRSENERCPLPQKDENEINLALKCKIKKNEKMAGLTFET